jgi:hypothetical protein
LHAKQPLLCFNDNATGPVAIDDRDSKVTEDKRMPFIPAIIEAAVGIGEAVAAGAEAAATAGAAAGAEAGAVGAEAGAVGAEAGAVGGEAGAVGGEAGAVGGEAGEVGGEGASSARSLTDIGKDVYQGAKKAHDIYDKVSDITNNNGNNNSQGNVGIHPLASAIDSMSGGSSVGDSDSLFQNHENVSEGPSQETSGPYRAALPEPGNVGVAPEDNSGSLADIGQIHGSGNMRI